VTSGAHGVRDATHKPHSGFARPRLGDFL